MSDLTLMAVHAHPDDETTSGGASLAMYQSQGIKTVVVTCTDGAEGEMHDPDLDPVDSLPRLAEIRRGEMERAAKILNLTAHEWLGYRDSGMVGTPPNQNPANFLNADMYEATGRLVSLVRKYKPQVMFTYNSFGGYGHPDHIQAHKISAAAFDYAADIERYPEDEFGPAWQPLKLYTVAFSRSSWHKVWQALKDNGEEWPLRPPTPPKQEEQEQAGDEVAPKEEPIVPAKPKREFPPEFGSPDTEITTVVDVGDFWKISYEALITHRTQISLDNPFWKMRTRFAEVLVGNDYFVLFKSHVPAQRPEKDLFVGIR